MLSQYHNKECHVISSWNIIKFPQEPVEFFTEESKGRFWDFKIIDTRTAPAMQCNTTDWYTNY